MQDLLTLWNELTLLNKIYWVVAIPSTLLFAIQLVLSLIGKDVDADFDADVDVDISHAFGGHILSFKTIISFLTMFSWSGILAQMFGITQISTLVLISFIAGIATMFSVAFILYSLMKMNYSGTLNLENAIGETGYVYLSIPPKMTGKGKIQINIQSSLRTLDAMTEDLEKIPSNTNIEVVSVLESDILLVKRKR